MSIVGRRGAAVAVIAAALLAGCGSSTATVTDIVKRDSGTGAMGARDEPLPVVTAEPPQLAPGYGGAQLTACATDKTTLIGVLDAYFTLNGSYPQPTGTNGWSSLVEQSFLRKASDTYRYDLVEGQPSLIGLPPCG